MLSCSEVKLFLARNYIRFYCPEMGTIGVLLKFFLYHHVIGSAF